MLVDSLLETGLDTQSMLGSYNNYFPPVVVVYQYPAPYTPPTTTTPAPTLPPNRRRVVASTAFPNCEDVSPPDILDSDCYAQRYGNIAGGMFPNLGSVSRALKTTQTYLSNLEPVIAQVTVPMMQQSLGTAVLGSVADANLMTTNSLSSAQAALNRSIADTTTMNGTIALAASRAIGVLTNFTTAAMYQFLQTQVRNMNALVRQANALNLGGANVVALRSLQAMLTGTKPMLDSHADLLLRQQVGGLAAQRDALDSSIFYRQSNLSTVSLPLLQGRTQNWTIARGAQLVGWNNASINTLISMGNMTATYNNVTATISGTIANFSSDLNGQVGYIRSQTTQAMQALTGSVADTSANLTAQFNQFSAGVNGGLLSMTNKTAYTQLNVALTNLITTLGVNGSGQVDAWDLGAQAALSRLTNQLANATSYLKAGSSGTAGSDNDAVMKLVLASMAAIGTLQQQIDNTMLARQTQGVDAVKAMTNQLSTSGVTFAALLRSVTILITALSNANTGADDGSAGNLFTYLPAAIDRATRSVAAVAAEGSANVTAARLAIQSGMSSYTDSVRAFWKAQLQAGWGAQYRQAGADGTTAAIASIAASAAGWKAIDDAMADDTAEALRQIGATSRSLPNYSKPADDGASQLFLGIANQADSVAGNYSRIATDWSNQFNTMWNSIRSQLDNLVRTAVADLNDGSSAVKDDYSSDIDSYIGTVQGSNEAALQGIQQRLTGPLADVASAARAAVAGTGGPQKFADGTASVQAGMLSSLASEEGAIVQNDIPVAAAAVQAMLAPLDTDRTALNAALDLSTRVSDNSVAVTNVNTTLNSVIGALYDTGSLLTAADQSGDSVRAMMIMGSRINALMDAEAQVINGSVSDVEAIMRQTLAEINQTASDARGRLQQTVVDRLAAFLATQWTDVVSGMRADLLAYSANPTAINATNATIPESLRVEPLLQTLRSAVDLYEANNTGPSPTVGNITASNSTGQTASELTGYVSDFSGQLMNFIQGFGGAASAPGGIYDQFRAQMQSVSNQSASQAAVAAAGATAAVKEALGSITNVSNAQATARGTVASSVEARTNSVAAVVNALGTAQTGMQNLLQGAIGTMFNTSSMEALAMANSAANMSVSALVAAVTTDLRAAELASNATMRAVRAAANVSATSRALQVQEIANFIDNANGAARSVRSNSSFEAISSDLAAAEANAGRAQSEFDTQRISFWTDVSNASSPDSIKAPLQAVLDAGYSPESAVAQMNNAVTTVDGYLALAA